MLTRSPLLFGQATFRSVAFSNRWTIESDRDGRIAEMFRVPSRHISVLNMSGLGRIDLVPNGWGRVEAIGEDGRLLGSITRTSWWGRSWEMEGEAFACALTSDPMPRRWTLRLGREPVGTLAGSLFSYNRLRVHTDVAVPVVPIALAWHVIARPWEQAAAPRALARQAPATSDG